MPVKKTLPWPFWVLVFLAILVAIVLLVGLLLENKDKLSFSLPARNDKKENLSEPSVPVEATNGPALSACTATPIPLELPGGLRLVGWEPSPIEFSFWALDEREQKIKKWTFNESATHIQASGSQDLLCPDRQKPECIYPSEKADHFIDLNLVDRLGFAQLKNKRDESSWIAIRKNGALFHFFNTLGLCGFALHDRPWFFISGFGERQTLVAIPSDPTFLLNYAVGDLRPYSSSEVPLHPAIISRLNGEGIETFNCADPSPVEQTVDADYFDGRMSVLAKHSRLISRPDLWLLKVSPSGFSGQGRIAGDSLTGALHSARWRDNGVLSLNSANFFRTSEQSLDLKADTGRVTRAAVAHSALGQTLLSREEITSGKRMERAAISFSDAKHTKPAFARGHGEATPLEMSLPVGAQARWLWSARGPDTSLLIGQGGEGEPITAFRVHCTVHK